MIFEHNYVTVTKRLTEGLRQIKVTRVNVSVKIKASDNVHENLIGVYVTSKMIYM